MLQSRRVGLSGAAVNTVMKAAAALRVLRSNLQGYARTLLHANPACATFCFALSLSLTQVSNC